MSYGLHIRFIDQSESYVLGFEAGMLYQQMKDRKPLIEQMVHTSAIFQIQQIAGKEGYSTEFEHMGSGWSQGRFKDGGVGL